jgi:FlaA1/EpsC-like NDP-sugar epimerase
MTTSDKPETHNSHSAGGMRAYFRFAAMIITSTVIMYAAMYLNTYQWGHVFFSETRAYMSLIMGAIMAAVMLTFMLRMHSDWRLNVGIYTGSVVLFAVALWLVRSQRTVDEVSYMKAMIPHHSIAILTSERAQISDARVRKLADQIIEAQRREIEEMKTLIESLTANRREPN